MKYVFSAFALLSLLAVSGCSGVETEAKYPTGADRALTGGDIYAEPESIFGKDGLQVFGGRKKSDEDASGITVNSYLWRASLDTVSFMPLANADPFGGVILTDWYTPENTSGERLKLNVFILSRELRSDGIRVRVFRQEKRGGQWVDVEPAPETARQLEDAILQRARELRFTQAGLTE